MFALRHTEMKNLFAQFDKGTDDYYYVGSGATPTVFLAEHIAHEERDANGLDKHYDVVKLVVED